ncbi:hypothetical protein DdX_18071 [Ditylenchus destructor]|uniref:Uncharacterized protein n=1 Tax=Ditylenchus destructor TaxID=166010 RepID=A0AAD4QYH1_9BILA|nr:hypothetical protein DdX_18071 [Ditylenchus destructor]
MVRKYYIDYLIDIVVGSRGVIIVAPQWIGEIQGNVIQGVVRHGVFLGKDGQSLDIRNASSAFTQQEILDYGNFHSFLVPSSKHFTEE